MPTKYFDLDFRDTPGAVFDRPGYIQQPSALTGVRNCRIANQSIHSFPGWRSLDATTTPANVDKLYYIQTYPYEGGYYWSLFGVKPNGDAVFVVLDEDSNFIATPTTSIDIEAGDQWSGGVFNGVSIVNNGILNYPFYLGGSLSAPVYVDLPFDDTNTWRQAQVSCYVLRPFKSFLVALGIYRNAQYYPHLLSWSDAADPGSIPGSWDVTDPTLLAGETSISETSGYLVDFLPLGDVGLIYKEDSIWGMTLTSSLERGVFQFRSVLPNIGCLAPNCAVDIGNRHVTLTLDDIVLHDGRNPVSIIESRIRRHLFASIDTDNYRNSFLVQYRKRSEVWVCFPETGSVLPSAAAVWNWREDTWTFRELPSNTSHITTGVDILSGDVDLGDTWNGGADVAWDDPVDNIWSEQLYSPKETVLISVGADSEQVQYQDSLNTYGDVVTRCFAERQDIPLDSQERDCMVRRVYPLVSATGPVQISIGGQPVPGGAVTWDGPHPFVSGTDSSIDVRVLGKMIAWKIESEADVSWSFSGFRAKYTVMGAQ